MIIKHQLEILMMTIIRYKIKIIFNQQIKKKVIYIQPKETKNYQWRIKIY